MHFKLVQGLWQSTIMFMRYSRQPLDFYHSVAHIEELFYSKE